MKVCRRDCLCSSLPVPSGFIYGFGLTHGAMNGNNSPLASGPSGRGRLAFMKKNLEIEVKLACDDLGRLTRAGFELRLHKPRHFEDNWLLDDDNQTLFS